MVFALGLGLKRRLRATWKWAIYLIKSRDHAVAVVEWLEALTCNPEPPGSDQQLNL